jgi:hypothetical protein
VTDEQAGRLIAVALLATQANAALANARRLESVETVFVGPRSEMP